MKAAELQELVEEQMKPGYIHTGIRGRGLSKIVAAWTDELEFSDLEDGGIRTRVKKFLKSPRLKEEGLKPAEAPEEERS